MYCSFCAPELIAFGVSKPLRVSPVITVEP
jgi:hypothetical protein